METSQITWLKDLHCRSRWCRFKLKEKSKDFSDLPGDGLPSLAQRLEPNYTNDSTLTLNHKHEDDFVEHIMLSCCHRAFRTNDAAGSVPRPDFVFSYYIWSDAGWMCLLGLTAALVCPALNSDRTESPDLMVTEVKSHSILWHLYLIIEPGGFLLAKETCPTQHGM